MQFNTYMINAEGRNKYGDYRKPVRVGRVTSDSSSCTYTLTSLQVTYSSGSSLQPDMSNYATITGTFNTYVNGELRQSESGVTVTPIQNSENTLYSIDGNRVYYNYDRFSATTTSSSMQGVSGFYNGVTASSPANISIAANTSAITASEILSFHITTSVSSSATSFDASGLGRRTITFTSGAQSTPVSAYIGNQADGWLYIKDNASWVSTDGRTVYVQENQTSSARSAVLTLTDASFTSATNSLALTQSAGTPV